MIPLTFEGPSNTPREAKSTWGLWDSCTRDPSEGRSYSQHSSHSCLQFCHQGRFSVLPDFVLSVLPCEPQAPVPKTPLQGLPTQLPKPSWRFLTGSGQEENPNCFPSHFFESSHSPSSSPQRISSQIPPPLRNWILFKKKKKIFNMNERFMNLNKYQTFTL